MISIVEIRVVDKFHCCGSRRECPSSIIRGIVRGGDVLSAFLVEEVETVGVGAVGLDNELCCVGSCAGNLNLTVGSGCG